MQEWKMFAVKAGEGWSDKRAEHMVSGWLRLLTSVWLGAEEGPVAQADDAVTTTSSTISAERGAAHAMPPCGAKRRHSAEQNLSRNHVAHASLECTEVKR